LTASFSVCESGLDQFYHQQFSGHGEDTMSDEPTNDVVDDGEATPEAPPEETGEPTPEAEVAPPPPAPTLNPDDPIAAAAARSVDGRVAVIERGSGEAKVVEMPKPDGGNGAGEGEPQPEKPAAPEPIKVDEADVETVRETLQTLRNIEAQVAQNRMQYLEKEEALLAQRKDATSDLQSTIKTIGKRQKVPQDWMLNIETMSFEPPKRQAFPFARR
jgi:hypothetical protein